MNYSTPKSQSSHTQNSAQNVQEGVHINECAFHLKNELMGNRFFLKVSYVCRPNCSKNVKGRKLQRTFKTWRIHSKMLS